MGINNTILGRGVYGIPEASRLARVPVQTARRWFVGDKRHGALLAPSIPTVDGRTAISFLDLIDLLVVGQFRQAGVSLQVIRKAYTILRKQLNTRHAFSHHALFTDGRAVLMEIADPCGDSQLVDVISRQHAMPDILKQYLQFIEYDENTELAKRWRIANGVIIDPARNFGKPMVYEGVSTEILNASAIGNNDDFDLVADLYCVTPDCVKLAVRFERDRAA